VPEINDLLSLGERNRQERKTKSTKAHEKLAALSQCIQKDLGTLRDLENLGGKPTWFHAGKAWHVLAQHLGASVFETDIAVRTLARNREPIKQFEKWAEQL